MAVAVIAAYLSGLLFDPDNGGSTLLQKSAKIHDCIASQCRKTVQFDVHVVE